VTYTIGGMGSNPTPSANQSSVFSECRPTTGNSHFAPRIRSFLD